MKIKLDEIKWIMENEFKIHPEFPFEEQTKQLLYNLGLADEQLREWSYDILDMWVDKSHFAVEQLLEIANEMKKNILIGLGEKNTDTVFLRSFSALILTSIICYDQQCALGNIKDGKPFLTKELITDYFERSLKYYEEEKDVRGFIQVKGWAHSIAHGADLFKIMVRNRLIGKGELLRILEVFRKKIVEPQEDTYKGGEELRITVAVYTLFLRGLLETKEIIDWFKSFEVFITDKKWSDFVKEPAVLNAQLNLRVFLNHMYLMVKHGIANTGYFDLPYYQDNLLKDHAEIASVIESLQLQLDKNYYFIPEP